MNVDILCSSRELFGADRSALRLAEILKLLGHSPSLVLPENRPELGLAAAAAGREIPFREAKIGIASSGGIDELAATTSVRRSSADLTIFNSTAVLGAGRVTNKIIVVREWLYPHSLRHRLVATRHRVGAAAVVGVSSGVISQWRMCVRGPSRQYVVHNWLDDSALDQTRRIPNETGREGILCIGRFNRWKGQEMLADAYEQAFAGRSDRPSLRFVGAQPGTAFEARAAHLASRGQRLGWEVLPFVSVPGDHFRSAALVTVPSLQPEPFGMVILEAISHGCRVIAFEGGGPSDLAESFPGVVKLVPRDTDHLARALAEWWDTGGTALSTDASVRARRTLESGYSPRAAAAAWRAILSAL